MSKSITFTIVNDADALRILNGVCDNNRYGSNKLKDSNPSFDDQLPEHPQSNPMYINIETKQEFFRRMTLNWWAGSTAQAESRAMFKANEAEITAFEITSSEV